jgi:hypothetical protein
MFTQLSTQLLTYRHNMSRQVDGSSLPQLPGCHHVSQLHQRSEFVHNSFKAGLSSSSSSSRVNVSLTGSTPAISKQEPQILARYGLETAFP